MIIAAGEAVVDLTSAGDGRFHAQPGGSPYNVAVAVGRLEVPAGFLGALSGDPFGRMLAAHLASNGVADDLVVQVDAPTMLAFAHQDGPEPAYSFYAEGTSARLLPPDPPPLPPGAMLHVGSFALVLEPGASSLAELLRRESRHRLISLDPNVRPTMIGNRAAYLRQLAGWLALVDIAKVSAADLAWLYPDRPALDVAAEWLAAGVTLVLVTAGATGATAATGTHRVAVPGRQVAVVDTIGAGDTFTAAALAWLAEARVRTRDGLAGLTEAQLAELLRFANAAAAWTCTRRGCDPPRRADLAAPAPS